MTNTTKGWYRDRCIIEWVKQNRPDVVAAANVEADKKFPPKTSARSFDLPEGLKKLK